MLVVDYGKILHHRFIPTICESFKSTSSRTLRVLVSHMPLALSALCLTYLVLFVLSYLACTVLFVL